MGADFLQTIIEKKQEQVTAAEKTTPLSFLREKAENRRDFRGFASRLESGGAGREKGKSPVRIIAEIKRASPSKGVIRADADAAETARAYERGGAAAISVLTETEFFKGGIDDLKDARKIQDLPVLRKDFIVSEYQVYESAAIGADAILLIVRILEEAALGRWMALAEELGMDALVEVHTAAELEIAVRAGAQLIGINNRNLDSFETDPSVSTGLAKAIGETHTAVAASGIGSRADIEAGVKAGIRNFLVGESIMRAKDPEAFLRALAKDI